MRGALERWLDRIARFATTGGAVALVAVWSFGEAVVLPIVPDVALDLLGLAAPRRAPWLFLVGVIASLAGTLVLFAYATSQLTGAEALVLAVPAIDQPMIDAARATVAGGDPTSIALFGPGTPLKVFTVAWAADAGPLAALAVGAILNRLSRIGPALLACVGVGAVAPAWLRRHERLVLGLYAAFWLVTYAAYWTGAV
jgi:hypothetical protein